MSGNQNVTKDFSKSSRFLVLDFADISKIFTSIIKVIYLEINNEYAIILTPLLKLLNIAIYW